MAAVPSLGRASAVAPPSVEPEADATRDLYERYSRQILNYCVHQLGGREEAEDAMQSTFLNAFRGLKRGVAPEFESAWLFKIAHNVCLTRQRSSYRRRRVESPGDLDALQDLLPSPQREADELVRLPEALQGMPEQQRRALLLREWQGLSYKEIAQELSLTQPAVETLLFRARRSLAHGLTEEPRKRLRGRLRAGGDAGSIIAAIKTLVFAGGGKVVATAATVAAGSVVAAPTVRDEVEHVVAARATYHQVAKPAAAHAPAKAKTTRVVAGGGPTPFAPAVAAARRVLVQQHKASTAPARRTTAKRVTHRRSLHPVLAVPVTEATTPPVATVQAGAAEQSPVEQAPVATQVAATPQEHVEQASQPAPAPVAAKTEDGVHNAQPGTGSRTSEAPQPERGAARDARSDAKHDSRPAEERLPSAAHPTVPSPGLQSPPPASSAPSSSQPAVPTVPAVPAVPSVPTVQPPLLGHRDSRARLPLPPPPTAPESATPESPVAPVVPPVPVAPPAPAASVTVTASVPPANDDGGSGQTHCPRTR